MSTTPPASTSPAPGARLAEDPFHEQLYRYAQDLDDLLLQHQHLQQRHRALEQAAAQESRAQDPMLALFCTSPQARLITDAAGHIERANLAARRLLQGARPWPSPLRLLGDGVDAQDRAGLMRLLAGFSDHGAQDAIVHARLKLLGRAPHLPGTACQALVLPVRNHGVTLLHWLLAPADGEGPCLAQALRLLDCPARGTLVTDLTGQVTHASDTLCGMTGYPRDELLGRPATMLGGQGPSKAFDQAYWAQLQLHGSWSGEFLSRRKDGKVYSDWRTVRQLQDSHGQQLGYVAVVNPTSQAPEDAGLREPAVYFDSLTGLPNRRLAEDRFGQLSKTAQRQGSGMALLFIDLDGFRPINDSLGHDTGDAVLQVVASRLAAVLRGGDTVARVGGDEFIVLLPHGARATAIEDVADKVLAALSVPIPVASHRLFISASIGAARFPDDGTDLGSLLRHADAAMLAAKKDGGNRFRLHTPQASTPARLHLGQDIWLAAERGEMSLVFQPQVTAGDERRLRGLEALLRWSHPTHGTIDPGVFVPVAEANGAIVPLGLWVLRTACEQLARWDAAGLPPTLVAVNVSYVQVQDPGFIDHVEQILQQTGVSPGRLELEITESTTGLLGDQHLQRLQGLRRLGVRVAIDDFGVGYSSLKRLSTLPADTLKIDKHFTKDLGDPSRAQDMSQLLVGIGLTMGMEVIAEGIERPVQADVLRRQGCHVLQGHLTGRPMPAHQLLAWLNRQQAHGALVPGIDTPAAGL